MANPVLVFGPIQEGGFTSDDSVPRHVPGTVVCITDADDGLKAYKYVRYNNGTANLTLANGDPCLYDDDGATFDGFEVFVDVSDTNRNLVAGVALGAITDGNYGWVQIKGFHSAVNTDGGDDIAVGDALIHDGTNDQDVDSVAAGTAPTNHVVGWAVGADVDASDTVPAYLVCPL